MPYSSTSRLPTSVKNTLPKGAQTIYLKAFENAWEEYKAPDKRRGRASREEAAHKVAWSAVKTKYQKNGEGKWSTRSSDGGSGTVKSASAKSSKSTAKPAKTKSTAAGTKQKSARKSPARMQTKSEGTKRKTAAKSGGRTGQARWKSASAQKPGQKARGRAAASRGTKGQQKSSPRKSRKSAAESATQRRQQRQELVNASQPSAEVNAGLPAEPSSQRDAGQVS